MKDKSYKTAITRKVHSVPMRWLIEKGHVKKGQNGLDFGCGKGFDADELGFVGYDPHFRPELPEGEFDVITSIYMLNVIQDDHERARAEMAIIALADENKCRAYMAIRNDTQALNGCTGKGTWQGFVRPTYADWEIIETNARFTIHEYTAPGVPTECTGETS